MLRVVAFIVVFAVCSMLRADDQQELDKLRVKIKTDAAIATNLLGKDVTGVWAGDMIEEYRTNEVAADLRFKGKLVMVWGFAGKVSRDIANDAYVTLRGLDEERLTRVQCMFTKKYENNLAVFKPDDLATIFGICDGLFGNVLIRECGPPGAEFKKKLAEWDAAESKRNSDAAKAAHREELEKLAKKDADDPGWRERAREENRRQRQAREQAEEQEKEKYAKGVREINARRDLKMVNSFLKLNKPKSTANAEKKIIGILTAFPDTETAVQALAIFNELGTDRDGKEWVPVRIWATANDHWAARFDGIAKNEVSLRMLDDSIKTVAVDTLCNADRQFIAKHRVESAAKPAKAENPAKSRTTSAK